MLRQVLSGLTARTMTTAPSRWMLPTAPWITPGFAFQVTKGLLCQILPPGRNTWRTHAAAVRLLDQDPASCRGCCNRYSLCHCFDPSLKQLQSSATIALPGPSQGMAREIMYTPERLGRRLQARELFIRATETAASFRYSCVDLCATGPYMNCQRRLAARG